MVGACADLSREVPRTYSSAGEAAVIFADNFDRAALGPDWRETGPGAKIVAGALEVAGLKNHPLWLTTPLPDNFRIEFDARALGEDGDIKVEFAGDGQSFARTASYVASGYVLIFGGWNNSIHALVRRDEHGNDRRTVRGPPVETGRRYHFVITRKDGLITWELDGQEFLQFDDTDPLTGPGHQHFAFGNWESPVQFDNLIIQAL